MAKKLATKFPSKEISRTLVWYDANSKTGWIDIKEFKEYYNKLSKKYKDCEMEIENDIINSDFDLNIEPMDFIRLLEGNNNIDGRNQQISGSDNTGITK
jgi:hypothetical protein